MVRLLSSLLATLSFFFSMAPLVSTFKGIPVTQHRYPFDGIGNNEYNPSRGAVQTPRVRLKPNGTTSYLDRKGDVPMDEENSGLPSARRVMEELFRFPVQQPMEKERRCDLLLNFGNLIAMDLAGKADNTSEPFDIPCDGNLNDLKFCPATGQSYCATNGTSGELNTISAYRSQYELVPDENGWPVRATINQHTAYLDMEFIYGRSKEECDQIRIFEAGQLDLVDTGNGLLPRDPSVRGNFDILPGRYALTVVFMRFHNYVAKYIMEGNPSLTDEEIFQSTRNYVIGTYQKIVSVTYITAILGEALGAYQGYDPDVDPSIDEFFAAVAYRYAHTEQPNVVRLMDENYDATFADPLFLRDVFRASGSYAATNLVETMTGGIETIIRGMTVTPLRPYDTFIVDDLNIWTTTSVMDIQRPRDAGIPLYNNVRRQMGMWPMGSIEELVTGASWGSATPAASPPSYDPYNFRRNAQEQDEDEDEEVDQSSEFIDILNNLYDSDIEKVDPAVGALFENHAGSTVNGLGPLLTISIKDQFNRVRHGDRFWYENVFSLEQRNEMLSMSEIIKLVCDGMDKLPQDAFSVRGIDEEDDETCDAEQTNQVSLLGGEMSMTWTIENAPQSNDPDEGEDEETLRSMEMTVTAHHVMDGAGFLGVGWRARFMFGADIWFCRVNPSEFGAFPRPFPDSCDVRQAAPEMFLCCVATGVNVVPTCREPNDPGFYELNVLSWCLSTSEASVTLRTAVCNDDDEEKNGCFELASNSDGTIDVIAAFNPSAQNTPHGFQRRTSSVVDLRAGILTAPESGVADTGLIAYHAVTMLVFWMFLAPMGIYIARYMKTKTWRLIAHISIMGAVGGLMLPILIGVEFAVGATEKRQEHAVIGLGLAFVILPMFLAGRIRYSKLQGNKVGRRTALVAYGFHKFSGYVILIFAWWNCYTGLVRISPADSFFQLVVISSFPLGYNIPIFGIIKDYIYWPYLALVIVIFLVAEMRKIRLNGVFHTKKLKGVEAGHSLWDDAEDQYDEMTMEKFLELTRLGSALCIVDGRVLDISGFMDHHPGGRDVLVTCPGSDITEEVAGLQDIEGFKHVHSYFALQKMKTLIIAVLTDQGVDKSHPALSHQLVAGHGNKTMDTENPTASIGRHWKPVFHRGRILDVRFISPFSEISESNKPVVMLRLAVKSMCTPNGEGKRALLPSSCFKFRVVNPYGSTFEAYYTPVRLMGTSEGQMMPKDDEETFDFIISLRPGGQISKASLEWKVGKALAIQGPTVNPDVLNSITSINRNTIVTLFASGTGIAPMLQLIDFYCAPSRVESAPHIFLVWVLKGPEHDYSEWIGLEKKVNRMRGKFRWITVYSSSRRKAKVSSKSMVLSEEPKKEKKSSTNRGSLFFSKSFEQNGRRKENITSSVYRPSTVGQFRIFKGNRGRLIDSIRHQDPNVFASRVSARRRDSTISTPLSHADFWLVANKAVSVQLNQDLVENLLTSIQSYCSSEESDASSYFQSSKEDNANTNSKGDETDVDGRYVDLPGRYKSEGVTDRPKGDTDEENDRDVALAKDVTRAFKDSINEPNPRRADMLFYVCGSPKFDDDIRVWIGANGFANDQIVNFYASNHVSL